MFIVQVICIEIKIPLLGHESNALSYFIHLIFVNSTRSLSISFSLAKFEISIFHYGAVHFIRAWILFLNLPLPLDEFLCLLENCDSVRNWTNRQIDGQTEIGRKVCLRQCERIFIFDVLLLKCLLNAVSNAVRISFFSFLLFFCVY